MKVKLLMQLFISFFKIGMISFGGGYAVIPLFQRELVEYRKWVEIDELTDMMSIAQTLPGIIFVNSATIVGYKIGRFWGAFFATLASITPTFVLILVITAYFWKYTDNPILVKAFTGVLLGVSSLVIYSITKMWKTAVKNYFDIILVVLSTLLLLIFKVNAIIVIIGTASIGFLGNLLIFKAGGMNK